MSSITVVAFNIADEIYIKSAKAGLDYTLISEQPNELFYTIGKKHYILILSYGVIVFANLTADETQSILEKIHPFLRNPLSKPLQETYQITQSQKLRFEYDTLMLPKMNENVIKNVMFNLAQSVALDEFQQDAESLLVDIRHFASVLEQKGTLDISKKNMRKFLGRALTVKNNVIENLYIFDDPDAAWDDEYVDSVNAGLVKFFNLRPRHKEIETTFKVIEDNLSVLMTLSHQKESSRLDWIIIGLIILEILYFIVEK